MLKAAGCQTEFRRTLGTRSAAENPVVSNLVLTCARYNGCMHPASNPMTSTTNATTSSRVLVAEDDQSLRDALARVLAFEGYQVRLAADGAEVLADVAAHPPDVIVLDVMMPNVDGLTACRRLRQRGDRTPVLMLTARHEVSDR